MLCKSKEFSMQSIADTDINSFISRYSSKINSKDLEVGTLNFLKFFEEEVLKETDPLKKKVWSLIVGENKENNKPELSCLLDGYRDRAELEDLEIYFCINDVNSGFILNPAHYALIAKNKSYLKLFLKYFPNKRDFYGYTFAHFAAFEPYEPILKVLQKKGVDFFEPNEAGATAYNFLQYRIAHLPNWQDFFIYPFFSGPGFNRKFYLMRFKTEYLSRSILTASGLIGMRVLGPRTFAKEESDDLHAHLHEQLLHHWSSGEKDSSVYVHYLEVKDDGTPIPKECLQQLEVRARRDFSAGEFVTEYTGLIENFDLDEIVETTESSKSLNLDFENTQQCLNGNKGSNLAQFINCSAPNCGIQCVVHQGLPHVVIYALKGIKMHECLYYDYGRVHFEVLNIEPSEFAPKARSSFLKISKELAEMIEKDLQVDLEKLTPEERIQKIITKRYFDIMSKYLDKFQQINA